MATRSEQLTATIQKLAKQLGKEGTTTTDGLDEAQLATLADTLQAEITAAAEAEKAKKAIPDGTTYTVAPGQSLTTKRGIIGEGLEILATDLHDGLTALELFAESGHVLKKTK